MKIQKAKKQSIRKIPEIIIIYQKIKILKKSKNSNSISKRRYQKTLELYKKYQKMRYLRCQKTKKLW